MAALEIEHAKKAVDIHAIEINGKIVDWSKSDPRLKDKKKKLGK